MLNEFEPLNSRKVEPPERLSKTQSWEIIKTVAPIVGLFCILVVGAIFTFWDVLNKDKSDDFREVFPQIQKANLLLANNHLSQPQGDNALELFAAVLDKYPKHYRAKEGIKTIANRYLTIIGHFIAEEELDLAKKTLFAASTIKQHLDDTEFNKQLANLSAQLNTLEITIKTARAEQHTANTRAFVAHTVFKDRLKIGGNAPDMVFIPSGSFLLGSSPKDVTRDDDEGPQRKITMDAFAISVAEVSFDEFLDYSKSVGKPLPKDEGWGQQGRPVINVSWVEAKRYAHWLSQQTGHRYRLPTEAEWEYVARAGTTSSYSSGECLGPQNANYDDRDITMLACKNSNSFIGKSVHVRAYQPNPWGLFHIHGNVREWVEDCWSGAYLDSSADGSPWYPAEDGSCGVEGKRVLRGGAWDGSLRSARSANRYAAEEHTGSASFGIRLARDVED